MSAAEKTCTTLLLLFTMTVPLFAQDAKSVQDVISAAGRTSDDVERLRFLEQLARRTDLGADLKRDLDRILPVARNWVNPEKEIRARLRLGAAENGYLCDFLMTGMVRGGAFPMNVPADSPLYPIACLYEGRATFHITIQCGNIVNNKELRERNIKRAVECFRTVHKAYPENRIAAMHMGAEFPWPKTCADDPDAPEWANVQRQCLEKLADIVEWWIDNRMLSNGEFGGGWGDDCEMWRWWVPVLIGFEDPKLVAAQARFSKALLAQPHLADGYTAHLQDVEHTAEDTSDAITPMMHLEPNDPEWADRALRLLALFEETWAGRNRRGQLQFKSTYFNARKVSPNRKLACETPYHQRAMEPVLLYWQRTRSERVGRVIADWMNTWVDASARADQGKPPGVMPAAIWWPDGDFVRGKAPWWGPENAHEPPLYRWPSQVGALADALLLTWCITGEERCLDPIRTMAKLRLDYLAEKLTGPAEEGSAAWCASRLGVIRGTLAKYRLLTGDTAFDKLLERDASPYFRFLMTGNDASLLRNLKATADVMRFNFEGFTSEVRFTDRVMRWPGQWFSLSGLEGQRGRVNHRLLCQTVTGAVGSFMSFPTNAVRWLTPPREIAALVTETGRDRFGAQLFHFGDSERKMAAEFYLLHPGEYDVLLESDGEPAGRSVLRVTGRGARTEFTIPPGRLCTLTVTRRK